MTTTTPQTTSKDRTRVIVTSGPCECRAVRSTHAHHCDFPELNAEGGNATEAGVNLSNLLLRARDNVGGYRREAIEKAILDVREFVGHDA
jgi:hypothetical protein